MNLPQPGSGAPRPAAVAGRFYPDDPGELEAMVDGFLAERLPGAAAPDPEPIKALIVPHAGYMFSGAVAGAGYTCLRRPGEPCRERVVLIGPAHRWPVRGLAAPASSAFLTPLGAVPVDVAALDLLQERGLAEIVDEAHMAEHALEVQLPFLQRTLPGGFRVVPLVAGHATAAQVSDVLETLWGGEETLIVISSDLSHFHDDETARRLDGATSAAIEGLAPDAVGEEGACGRIPIQGLLAAAARHGLRARTAGLCNSSAASGDRGRVVGYGAYVFS